MGHADPSTGDGQTSGCDGDRASTLSSCVSRAACVGLGSQKLPHFRHLRWSGSALRIPETRVDARFRARLTSSSTKRSDDAISDMTAATDGGRIAFRHQRPWEVAGTSAGSGQCKPQIASVQKISYEAITLVSLLNWAYTFAFFLVHHFGIGGRRDHCRRHTTLGVCQPPVDKIRRKGPSDFPTLHVVGRFTRP